MKTAKLSVMWVFILFFMLTGAYAGTKDYVLEWDVGEPDIVQYVLYYREGSSVLTEPLPNGCGDPATECEISIDVANPCDDRANDPNLTRDDQTGKFSYALGTLSDQNVYFFAIKAVDCLGQESPLSDQSITLLVTSPSAPFYINSSEDDNFQLSGYADPLSDVEIYLNDSLKSTVSAEGTGSWAAYLNLIDLGVAEGDVNFKATYLSGASPSPAVGGTYDATQPESTVNITRSDYNDANWVAAASISGTASDDRSGLAKIDIRIKRDDNKYWDGSDWVSGSDTWLTADGTENWSYTLQSTELTDGAEYTVESRATDLAGNVQTVFGSDSFMYDVAPADSIVDMSREHYNSVNWSATDSIGGTASDASSGVEQVHVRIGREYRRLLDGHGLER